MACANCGAPSDYRVADPGANPVEYCNTDLPDHLRLRAQSGHFPIDAVVVAEPEVVAKKK